MVYESSGMMAALLGASFEAFVLDNEMLGHVNRTLRGVEVNDETLGLDAIRSAVMGEGHFLGEPQTMAAMERDYYYPNFADREAPITWTEKGEIDIRDKARAHAKKVLAEHHPDYLGDADAKIRDRFKDHIK